MMDGSNNMPKYFFYCKKCNFEEEKIVAFEKRKQVKCLKCGNFMLIRPPVSLKNITNELVDCYHNKAVKKDINKIMKKREIDHVVDHELKEYVEKHGLTTIKKTNYWRNKKGKIV